jgi:hypothetical protein
VLESRFFIPGHNIIAHFGVSLPVTGFLRLSYPVQHFFVRAGSPVEYVMRSVERPEPFFFIRPPVKTPGKKQNGIFRIS